MKSLLISKRVFDTCWILLENRPQSDLHGNLCNNRVFYVVHETENILSDRLLLKNLLTFEVIYSTCILTCFLRK